MKATLENDCTTANLPQQKYERHGYRDFDRLREQVADGSNSAFAAPSVTLEYIGGECSNPAALFNTPDAAWDICTSTVDVAGLHPLPQPVVTQRLGAPQVPEVTLDPTLGEPISADVPMEHRHGHRIDILNPLLPSNLTPVPPVYTGDSESPITFLRSQEDTHRALCLPAMRSDNASAPAPFYQPRALGLVMESPQVTQVLGGVAESMFSHPSFLQVPWPFNHVAANSNLNISARLIYGRPNNYMRSSQSPLPYIPDFDCDDTHKLVSLFSNNQDVVDDPPKTSASNGFHRNATNVSSDNASSSRRLTILAPIRGRDPSYVIVVEAPSFRAGTSGDTNAQIESDPATKRLGSGTW
ncbi:hypothetical protein PM082_005108 [Marasmius tenuissimus]|nr:hypothetical protein PM082_005108 [Marasmius tenuissimus]